jgi:two-component system, chemotaxis family, sensor kinase CheA
MTNEARAVEDYLDDMALKIMMIEPGDLSVVGELLELVERLMAADVVAAAPQLAGMSKAFLRVLELIIMGEAADSGENYDRLAQCIVQMQDIARKKEEAGDQPLALFCEHMVAIGYRIEPGDLVTGDAGAGPGKEAEKAEAAVNKPAIPDFLQDRELISGFITESTEHLQSIEVNVLELENNPGNREIINNIFRTFHTIKGVSGFLNLHTINELAHSTENLLDDVRNGKMAMKSEVIDVVLSVGDFMTSMIRNIKDVLEKGPEQYLEFNIGDYVERILAIQQDNAGNISLEEQEPELEQEFSPHQAPPPEAEEEPEVDPPAGAIGETAPAAISGETPAPSSMSDRPDQPGQKGPAVRNRVVDAIKVDVDKLDGLVNAVGELVIMQSLVRQNPLVTAIGNAKLTRDFSQLSRITTEVQRTAMSMRMVPIRQTFKKMIRLVRDLSMKSGKQVDLIMNGEETEIDRNMVDSIYDPLVHMIRNSVDHGVQLPAERVKLGKSPAGTLHLRAYQKGGNIVIEIEDDGQGLNTEKIRKKAVERGLLNAADSVSDHEINNLIFLPGFSTADTITDVSGRGVGMDVVKKAVEKLRGTVEVQSQPSKGSLFLLRLPLTLAIIDGIIVRVGLERYVIPTISIQESLRPETANYSTVHGKGENLLIRDRLIPIIRLYEKFGVVPTNTDPLQAIMVVVENEGRKRALMVDELLGKQEVVIKSLGAYLHDTKGVAGGTILGDGRVGLILDLAGLIGTAVSSTSRGAVAKSEDGTSAAEIF